MKKQSITVSIPDPSCFSPRSIRIVVEAEQVLIQSVDGKELTSAEIALALREFERVEKLPEFSQERKVL